MRGISLKTEEMVIFIGVIGTGILIMVLIIWFVSTYHRRMRRAFREPAETSGTILDIHVKRDYVHHPEAPNYEPYVIIYSYYAGGCMHETSFECSNRKIVHPLKTGDRIVVYYDRQNPDNAVAKMQTEWEKSMWWKMLLGFAVIIIPAVIITYYVTNHT